MVPRARRRNRALARLAAPGLAILVSASGPAIGQPPPGSPTAFPYEVSARTRLGQRFMGIRLLGALRLGSAPIDGRAPRELSGLAWDEDDGILYAVSDGGSLFHFLPEFRGERLTGLAGLAAYPLRDADGRALRGARADSEGLDIENGSNGVPGDARLVVAFERHPRLTRYGTDGRYLESLALPGPLAAVSAYASANKSLESVTRHPRFGWLTAPERPMRGSPAGIVPLYGLDGGRWEYPLREVPNNSLVAMEALEDGSLVTLERGHGLLYSPLILSLRRTFPLDSEPGRLPDPATAAVFDSSAGWRTDNLEGLARHRGRRFFLVSDDNENALQATILLYVEMIDPEPTDYRPAESDTRQENRR